MLLAIDVGNTQTVLGLFEGDQLRGTWRISSDLRRTSDELALLVQGSLASRGWQPDQVKEAVVGSVVPPLTMTVCTMVHHLLGIEALVVDHRVKLAIQLRVHEPSQLGADRIANACGALALYGSPVIVVDLGTAITFDVVADGGSYWGGIIAPGIGAAAESLVVHTSRLPRVDLATPATVIGRSTEEAIRSGLLWGTAVQIDGLVRLLWREMGSRCRVVATGGDAPVIVPMCETVDLIEPQLTLIGLRLIFEENRG